MNLLIEPELGVPFSADTPYMDLKARAEAACNTAVQLAEHGLDLTPLKEDKDTAASLATEYAENPEAVSKKVTPARMAKMRPASLVMTDGILQEFGHAIVENSKQVRHLVTNKLLLESENPDAKIRPSGQGSACGETAKGEHPQTQGANARCSRERAS